MPPVRLRESLVVVFALGLYWLMAASVSPRMGVTADEVVHLTGGFSYWQFNDYRLHPENGTLPMRVAALPLLGMDLKFPPLDHPAWLGSKANLVGEIFFYQLGNPLEAMLQRGRGAIGLFGVLACWLVWRWARGLFGRAAGGVALGLAVGSPALLAHGGLITSDLAFTACALAALSAVWRLLHRATWGGWLVACVACAACFLSKMSGAFIVPLIGLLGGLRLARAAPLVLVPGGCRGGWWLRGRRAKALAVAGLLGLTAGGSLALVWANYSFRFAGPDRTRSGFRDYYFSWDVVLDREPVPWSDSSSLAPFTPAFRAPQPAGMPQVVEFLRAHRLLPEAFLWGFAHTYKFAKERPAYFLGEYRKTGWRWFFPVTFLMKTTLPALALGLTGLMALAWWGRRPGAAGNATAWLRVRGSLAYRAAPLVLFFVCYWIMAIRMTLNLGHRHILPVYPAFYVLGAAAVLWTASRVGRTVRWGIGAAVVLHLLDSWSARPFYLAYFQPLIGGPEKAYHYLVESSLDWGQGLPDLRDWLGRRRADGDRAPVHLTYFGADSPRARGVEAFEVTRFGDEMNDSGPRVFPARLRAGWYVISATYFHCTFLPMRGTWAEAQESTYRRLLARLARLGAEQSTLGGVERRQLTQDAMDVELLQFSRLCHWLRTQGREPREMIGASLLVFNLTEAEVAAALFGPVPLDEARPLR